MNITKENSSALEAVLKVKLGPEDYEPRVNEALKTYQKRAQMPGFRPGKVPSSLIKKMYGKSVLVDEINKLLSDSLQNYIQENNLEVLGNPIPSKEQQEQIDWDTQKEFTFTFDLGLAPQFNVDLSSSTKFTRHKVRIDDALINKFAEDIRMRYGKVTNPESSEEKDVLFGEFAQLDRQGAILEGGILKNSSLAVDRVHDEETKAKLIGLKKDDHVVIDPRKVSTSNADLGAMLGIPGEDAEILDTNFRFTVFNISRMSPADLNEELFKKVYGEEVKTEEEFRNKIREELEKMFEQESEKKLKVDVMNKLIEDLKIELPDEFLKRWLIAVNEKPLTMDQVNSEYDQYSRNLRWQLIENKILKDNGVKVSHDEAAEYVRGLIQDQYKRYNQMDMDPEELDKTVTRILSDDKEATRIYEKLYSDKMMDLLRSKVTIEDKEVSYDEFFKA